MARHRDADGAKARKESPQRIPLLVRIVLPALSGLPIGSARETTP